MWTDLEALPPPEYCLQFGTPVPKGVPQTRAAGVGLGVQCAVAHFVSEECKKQPAGEKRSAPPRPVRKS